MTTSTVSRLPVRPRLRSVPGAASEPEYTPTTAEILATLRHQQLRLEAAGATLPPQEAIAQDAAKRATSKRRITTADEKAAHLRARRFGMFLFSLSGLGLIALTVLALRYWGVLAVGVR